MSLIVNKEVGDSLRSPLILPPVTRIDLIKYAGASGDFNPIHTIDDEAEKAGLPGVIAHGMWTMGNLAKIFTPHLEEGYIKTYQIRFLGMVFLNDEISLSATVTEKTAEEISFEVVATSQEGKPVLKGLVIFSLNDRKNES